MAAGAAKPVVQIEMPEGGVEIVTPHQHHDTAAKPDAFRIAGRTVDGLRRFDEFVGLALAIPGGVRGRRLTCRGGFGLVLGTKVAALGENAAASDQQRETGYGEATHDPVLEPEHPLTHKIPE